MNSGRVRLKKTAMVSWLYIDDTVNSPTTKISRGSFSVIDKILNSAHRYLAKYTSNRNMSVCQLSDTNSNLYHDGSSAALTGAQGDSFVRFERDWYYKCEANGASKWKLGFSLSNMGSGWLKFSKNTLMGVYEAATIAGKLYSRSGVDSAAYTNLTTFISQTQLRGTGYQIVDYEIHRIIALLFYAKYTNTNCQSICGSGTASFIKKTGQTDALGMVDTTPLNGNSMSVNFLGVENCWGNKNELVQGVVVNPVSANAIFRITDTEKGTQRDVQGFAAFNADAWITRMAWGANADVIGTAIAASSSTGYCDGYYLENKTARVMMRSASHNGAFGGVSSVYCGLDKASSSNTVGTRLAFRGNITELSDTAAFKSIVVTN